MDLRKIKPILREEAKRYRRSLPRSVQHRLDYIIFNRLLQENSIAKFGLLLPYVSTEIEVDTRALINWALKSGKRVACPRCVPDSVTPTIDFIEIFSFSDLKPGAFGVLEPEYNKDRIISNFHNSVCVVPGLLFDINGYRLGYGKGYYDRFLADYKSVSIGVCYHDCVKDELLHGRMDRTVDILISDKRRIKITKS